MKPVFLLNVTVIEIEVQLFKGYHIWTTSPILQYSILDTIDDITRKMAWFPVSHPHVLYHISFHVIKLWYVITGILYLYDDVIELILLLCYCTAYVLNIFSDIPEANLCVISKHSSFITDIVYPCFCLFLAWSIFTPDNLQITLLHFLKSSFAFNQLPVCCTSFEFCKFHFVFLWDYIYGKCWGHRCHTTSGDREVFGFDP